LDNWKTVYFYTNKKIVAQKDVIASSTNKYKNSAYRPSHFEAGYPLSVNYANQYVSRATWADGETTIVFFFNKNRYPEITDLASVIQWFKDNPTTIAYHSVEQTVEDISIPKTYIAYNKGVEFVQNENSQYGANPTITQEYFGKVGGNNE
jgi:hypothetical protein